MAQSKLDKKNSHGLSRTIPADVKRTVRKQCGFGCVVCGNGIYDYEHFEPPFKNAKSHDAAGITLLCPRCHRKKETGFLSAQTIKQSILNPKCLSQGFSKEVFDVGGKHPKIKFAGSVLENCRIPVEVLGEPLITIEPPEDVDGPFLISAKFQDSKGQTTLEIIKNEWKALNTNWDIQVSGGKIRIWEGKRKSVLIISAKVANEISIERINCTIKHYNIQGDETEFSIRDINSQAPPTVMSDCFAFGAPVGISIQ